MLAFTLINQNIFTAGIILVAFSFMHSRVVTGLSMFVFSLLPYTETFALQFVLLISLSTFLSISAISGTSAICYALFSAILILSQVFLGNLESLLFLFFCLNLAIFSLSYIRLTVLNFETSATFLVLLIQKTVLTIFIFIHVTRFSLWQSVFVMTLTTFFLLQVFSRILAILISGTQINFIGNSFLEISELCTVFMFFYTVQILCLVIENTSSVVYKVF